MDWQISFGKISEYLEKHFSKRNCAADFKSDSIWEEPQDIKVNVFKGGDDKEVIRLVKGINSGNLIEIADNFEKQTGAERFFNMIYGKLKFVDGEFARKKMTEFAGILIKHAKSNNVYMGDFEDKINKAIERNDLHKLALYLDGLNARVIGSTDRFNEVSDKQKLPLVTPNGRIDADSAQGYTGDCWFVSSVLAIRNNKDALKYMENKISVQEKDGKAESVTVEIKGEKFVIKPDELTGAEEYSSGDSDLRALEIAANRYREAHELRDISQGGKLRDGADLLLDDHYGIKRFDLVRSDSDLREYLTRLQRGNVISVVGTSDAVLGERAYDEDGNRVEIRPQHAYVALRADREYIYLINPWDSSKVLKFPAGRIREVFTEANIVEFRK